VALYLQYMIGPHIPFKLIAYW